MSYVKSTLNIKSNIMGPMDTRIGNRYVGIDILKVIAMLCVLFLHTIYSFTVRGDFFLTKSWFIFEPFSAVSKSSLALFFMISGYLIIHKNRTVRQNSIATVKRILIPFISFSLLSMFFFLFKTGKSISHVIDPSYIFQDVMKFPNNWLWFLETLLLLHLLNPLWQGIFSDKTKRKSAQYTVAFFFLFTSFAILLKYATHTLLFFNSYTTWVGYICCYLYGALIKKNWAPRKSLLFFFILFFIGLSMEVLGDYFAILNEKNGIHSLFSGYFSDYMSLPPLLMAIGMLNICIGIKKIRVLNKKISSTIQNIIHIGAGLSYGIYLTHIFISEYITSVLGWNVDSLHINIYLYNCLFFLTTLFVSALITFVLARIPRLRMIIGVY